MKPDDGGPAFGGTRIEPVQFIRTERGEPIEFSEPEVRYIEKTYYGMSLRDWFAGQALTGLIGGRPPCEFPKEGFTRSLVTSLSDGSYKIADAMLAERAKENK